MIHVSAFLRAAAASVLLPCLCTAWSLYLLTCSLQAHRVNERCDLEDDNRSHDELDDTGDEEQHAGLCMIGIRVAYVVAAWCGGVGGKSGGAGTPSG